MYDDVMRRVEDIISDPSRDTPVSTIFSDAMFEELCIELDNLMDAKESVEFRKYWTQDFSKRLAIQQFLKDSTLGEKRLTSMPDRITNTISLMDGRKFCRPSVINAYYATPLGSVQVWWTEWKAFFFHSPVQCYSEAGEEPPAEPMLICNLIGKIQRSKYPAITLEEQAISVPLQLLCLAILDAIFLHVVTSVAPLEWENVRKQLCDSMIVGKELRVCNIISTTYHDTDVFFVQVCANTASLWQRQHAFLSLLTVHVGIAQEAAAVLSSTVRGHAKLSEQFALLQPRNLDGKRDQNSFIFVARRRFDLSTWQDVTNQVLGLTLTPASLSH